MRKQAAKNVLMKDGTARRLPADQCESLLANGQAKRFISNTVYRAMKLGVEVKNPGTRDEGGALRRQIKDAREKVAAKEHKAAKKKKAKQKELAEMSEAQEVLNAD